MNEISMNYTIIHPGLMSYLLGVAIKSLLKFSTDKANVIVEDAYEECYSTKYSTTVQGIAPKLLSSFIAVYRY